MAQHLPGQWFWWQKPLSCQSCLCSGRSSSLAQDSLQSLALTSCQCVCWISPIIQGAFRLGVWGLYVSELLSHWGTSVTGTFALSHPCGVEMLSCCISHSQQEWPVWLYLSCSYMQKAQRLHTSKFCCCFSSSTSRAGSAEPFTPGLCWSSRMKVLLGTCAVTRWLCWVCELQPCQWPFLHARL